MKPSTDTAAPAAAMGLDGNATALSLLLCLLWGGLTPAIKASLEGMPPFGLAAVRFTLSWLIIAAWCHLERIPIAHRGDLLRLSGLGCLFVAQIFTLNIGTTLTSASHSVICLSTYPLFVGVLAHFFLAHDRLDKNKVLGLLAAFAGVAVTFWEQWQTSPHAGFRGDLLVLSSGFMLGLLVVATKRMIARHNPSSVLFWQLLLGTPLFGVGYLFLERGFRWHLTGPVLTGVVYQGVVISGICFMLWTRLLERYPASRLTAFAFTTPIFGVLLSWLIRHDPLTSGLGIGVGLVAAGIYLSNRGGEQN